MPQARHLLTVWNPSYADDAMDGHLRILLDWAERHARDEVEPDDVYVWWAKLRSPNREGSLPHAADVLEIDEQVQSGVETHLYLTDYRSLYVAHLGEVTDDDVAGETSDERDHMPEYYHGRTADFWFRLWDLRRLIAHDTPAVIEELKKLRNTRYHDKPVSLYGGMVELPLIVTREDVATWFAGLDPLLEGRLWAERDAELRGESQRIARDLRDNLFGPQVWHALEPASRTFLAAGEAVYRARRDDPRFDFSGPALEYAKAVETELNALIFPTIRAQYARKKPADREVRSRGKRLDLGGHVPHQTLGAVRVLLQKEDLVKRGVRTALQSDAGWLLTELPRLLEPVVSLRNAGAHRATTDRDAFLQQRRDLLGIGCEGLIVQIARAKMRSRS